MPVAPVMPTTRRRTVSPGISSVGDREPLPAVCRALDLVDEADARRDGAFGSMARVAAAEPGDRMAALDCLAHDLGSHTSGGPVDGDLHLFLHALRCDAD